MEMAAKDDTNDGVCHGTESALRKANGNTCDGSQLCSYVYRNLIGVDAALDGPFGNRRIKYCDFVASGRGLRFIEDFILQEVLPLYANTHTYTSVTGTQTSMFRQESRDCIRNAVNASEHDAVIFVGHGVTGAVHKLIDALKPALSGHEVAVFVSLHEHHSNLLPWRQLDNAEVVLIDELDDGSLDLAQLDAELAKRYSIKKLIGTFSIASNITGRMNDDLSVTATLHKYGALSFWDYATAAPYVAIDMNPSVVGDHSGLCRKDAIFFSMHKFVGGVQTPGVLVAKKQLFRHSSAPNGAGGGAVFFVTQSDHHYLKNVELREEGGTPAIVESIRAGLVMQLKQNFAPEFLMSRRNELMQRASQHLSHLDQFVLLGAGFHDPERHLPILSFVIKAPDFLSGYLHHNFVCSLLNDLFGIQARGGCMCAGPYAQSLLGLSQDQARAYRSLLLEDDRLDRDHLRRGHAEYQQFEILRPGFVRLNLPFFMPDDQIDFVLQALEFVSVHGWKLLPKYRFNNETGQWKHQTEKELKGRAWLGHVSYASGQFSFTSRKNHVDPPSDEEVLKVAHDLAEEAVRTAPKMHIPDQSVLFSTAEFAESHLRWILLPCEVQQYLRTGKKQVWPVPFVMKKYHPSSTTVPNLGSLEGKDRCAHLDDMLDGPKPGSFDLAAWFDDPAPQKATQIDESMNNFGVCVKKWPTFKATPNNQTLKLSRWRPPTKDIFKPFLEAVSDFDMIRDGDKVLVCLSGGKDSLSLLHAIRQYQFYSFKQGIHFTFGAVTVDPGSSAYDPSPLKGYLKELEVPYFYEQQGIMDQAKQTECSSICSFCSRMKRGRIYATARKQHYNVLALGQHLDDLAESFLMSVFHNGRLRTMKAHYVVGSGDLRVIRPFVYVREKQLRQFAESQHLPVISENCPACFEAPKERHRTKQLLAQQELLFPRLFWSLKTSLHPLMNVRKTGLENRMFGKLSLMSSEDEDDDEEDERLA